MKALDVAKLMAQYLGHKDLLETTSFGGQTEPTQLQQDTINTYLTAINDVVQSLGISYFPLKSTQTLTSENMVYSYNLFENTLLQILKVVDKNTNTKLRFCSYPEYFTTSSKNIVVSFCYQPDFVEALNDELDVVANLVSVRMVAMGAVSRYYLFEGLYTESTAWSNMFERSILMASRSRHTLYIDKRSWF
ncbi:MAG: hypothetical protein IJU58_02910 [Clostridia bacterium]|nr:hypothetical protein [Clostridia bacterium]